MFNILVCLKEFNSMTKIVCKINLFKIMFCKTVFCKTNRTFPVSFYFINAMRYISLQKIINRHERHNFRNLYCIIPFHSKPVNFFFKLLYELFKFFLAVFFFIFSHKNPIGYRGKRQQLYRKTTL